MPYFYNNDLALYICFLITVSHLQNPSEKNDKDTGEKRNVGENLLDPDPSHVIVDEEVDFDQFGAPPPDLPVVDDSERKQDKGIGSPDGESRAADVEELKDHVADTGEVSFYGVSVKH